MASRQAFLLNSRLMRYNIYKFYNILRTWNTGIIAATGREGIAPPPPRRCCKDIVTLLVHKECFYC